MKKLKKSIFSLPYIGIEELHGIALLYSTNGDYSTILSIENLVEQHAYDQALYNKYHKLLLNAAKILGEGHIIQKQDIFTRKKYQARAVNDFLEAHYQQHFQDRAFLDLKTYIIFTHRSKKSTFNSFDENAVKTFIQDIQKINDLFIHANLKPEILSPKQINAYLRQMISMDFLSGKESLNNILPSKSHLTIGEKLVRCLSLINTDTIDLPQEISPYYNKTESNIKAEFPVDNFYFFYNTPHCDNIIYNQFIDIPSQRSTISKLETKKNRHLGVPDPANNISAMDIERLLNDVARENQLVVNSHFSIIISSSENQIENACNYIESSLFQQGIIPSRNAYNQLELFRCSLPGNGIELKNYDWFLCTLDAAICLFFKERIPVDEKSTFTLSFTDRRGIPIAIDPSDIPMQTGRIKNRNRFVLGSSGTGKSYAINSIVEQYLKYNMDVVIVDVGHSYSGLCALHQGKYITYSEESPITMNPFIITEQEFNIEKKDFLVTLISLLWKGNDGQTSALERDVIAKVVSDYYRQQFSTKASNIYQVMSFNSFYEFAITRIPEIKSKENIYFDFDEFKFVLKKFYKGGEYETILNQQSDSSLFDEPLIVYEIDNIQSNKILLPIVTLIIMDLFIQKMRHRKNRRKTLILEEAWRALSSPIMASFLLYLNKTVRKFYGEIIEVTQEINDIIGNPIIKDSIINNSDTVILLQQNQADLNKVAELLNISEVEQRKILTINKLENKEGRSRFNELYIRRGSTGEVYGVEVSLAHHLVFTTEKPEKQAVEIYVKHFGDYPTALGYLQKDLQDSKLSLSGFIDEVNRLNAPLPKA